MLPTPYALRLPGSRGTRPSHRTRKDGAPTVVIVSAIQSLGHPPDQNKTLVIPNARDSAGEEPAVRGAPIGSRQDYFLEEEPAELFIESAIDCISLMNWETGISSYFFGNILPVLTGA
jgi:hypothetical protein